MDKPIHMQFVNVHMWQVIPLGHTSSTEIVSPTACLHNLKQLAYIQKGFTQGNWTCSVS